MRYNIHERKTIWLRYPSLYDSGRVEISCTKCEAMIRGDTEEDAAKAWNARVNLEGRSLK